MEEHEDDMFMQEREEIDDVFFRQSAILKHDLSVEHGRRQHPATRGSCPGSLARGRGL